MNRLIASVLIAMLAVFTESNATAAVGRTPGSFSVSSSGAATYTIPIWVPPGPRGLQPHLALTYSSSTSKGPLGVGWSLSGLPAISRCNKTYAQDSVPAAIILTTSDALCLNGKRLRQIVGAPAGTYDTEIAEFSKATTVGTVGNADYFTVKTKDGLTYEYGNGNNSRVLASGTSTASLWMLSKVTDRDGNTMTISYLAPNGALSGSTVPDTVSWTPTSSGASSYAYTVHFNYTGNAPESSIVGYVAGTTVLNSDLLASVVVARNSTTIKRYDLTYEISPTTGSQRLHTITECSNDLKNDCLSPTTVSYQDGAAGTATSASGSVSGNFPGLTARYDFNGDGFLDLAYKNGATWYVAWGSASGFGTGFNTGITGDINVSTLLGDVRGKGVDSILAVSSSTWFHYSWDQASNAFVSTNTLVPFDASAKGAALVDANGDGRPDLLLENSSYSIVVRQNTSAGGSVSFGSPITSYSAAAEYGALGITSALPYGSDAEMGRVRHVDFNGDGREDFALILAGCTPGPFACSPWSYIVTLLAGDNFSYASGPLVIPFPTGGVKLYYTDWNNDACTDIATSSAIYIASCTGSSAAQINLSNIVGTADWDGDGRTDILTAGTSDTTLTVYRSTGSGLSAAISTGVPYAFGCRVVTLDADSDGLDDVSCYRVTGTQGFTYYRHNSPATLPDLATSISDGYGLANNVVYGPANWSNHTKSSDAVYPNVDYQGPMYLARSTSSSDGVTPSGTYTTSYWYYGGKSDVTGRGFSGFASRRTIDSRNLLQAFDYFNQTFPVTGTRRQTDVYQSDGSTLISSEIVTVTGSDADTPASNQRFLVYVSGETGSRYEVGGPANGGLITQFSNSYTPDAFGNITSAQLTVTDKDSNSPNLNKAYTTSTVLTISPDSGSNWCLNQPTNSTVTYTATGSPTVVRTQAFAVDYTHCRAYQQIVEPNSAAYKVTRTLGFDSFGNVNSISTVGRNPDGSDMPARTELMGWGSTGQFLMTSTNALSQTTSYGYNFDFGLRTSVTDPNGIVTSQALDGYGRVIQVNHPDGTYVSISYNDCANVSGGCQNGDPASAVTGINKLVTIESQKAVGGTVIRDDWTYSDQLDRTIVTKAKTLSGSYSRLGTQYDALGRVARKTEPCDAASCTAYWTTMGYDAINRVTSQQRPTSETNPTLQTTTIQYQGRTTIFMDPQGKFSTRIDTVRGNVERTQDHDNYYQRFSYDAFGSLLAAVDSQSTPLFSASYNYGIGAFQTSFVDSDLGAKSRTFNALGELVAYSDAKGQSFSILYDALSRPTQRVEPDLTTVWTWGTSAAGHNIGALAQVSAGSHVESYAYDGAGRQSSRTLTIPSDGSYVFDMTYNSTTGLLDTMMYPTSTGGYRLKLQYAYQNGILKSISDANATSTVFWTATATNVRGQVTQETLGNGVINNRTFDAVTGWLSSIQSGAGSGAALQNESYLYDAVGNVTQRQNNNVGLTENFYYDNLYRLEHSTLGAITNLALAYDPTGNIASRNDVASGASWTYGSTRRHAVTQAGSAAYTYNYDANGNVTSRSGYSIDWTSYNHPSIINGAGGESIQFSYDQDHQRWRASYNGSNGIETTYFIGDLLEKVVTAGNNEYRHIITAGGLRVAIYSRTSAGANSLKYLGSDHQGSVASILNDDGTAYAKESFTAFGARRNSCTWSGPLTQGSKDRINAVTRHGYTWHMALGDMGLNDMNGRIQDAITGRFLSPDPTVPEPLNTQDYNRFSYARNNPLTFVDPTGFAEDLPTVTVSAYWDFSGGGTFLNQLLRQAMNDERASGLDPRVLAAAPFAWTAPLQEVKVTAPRDKPATVPGVKSCSGANCVRQEPQGHEYWTQSSVCKRPLTDDERRDLLSRFGIPNLFTRGNKQQSGLHLVTWSAMPGGVVRSTFSADGLAVSNVTTPVHAFVGTIDRSISNQTGGAMFVTHGYGNADPYNTGALVAQPNISMFSFYSLGTLRDVANETFGPEIFTGMDDVAAEYAAAHYAGC